MSDLHEKHAYLVIAHNNFWQLEKLMLALDYPQNDIFLHVDIRAKDFDQKRFETLCKFSQLHIYRKIAVRWARYEQIQVEMLLFENAVKCGPYCFYHLISGSDLPIKSQEQIHAYFDKHAGENFLDVHHVSCGTPEINRRAKLYHFFLGKGKWHRLLHRVLLLPQLLLGINRLRGKDVQVYFGSNWCSLTHEFVLYLLQQKGLCEELFRYVNSCDELFVQTIFKRGEFKLHSDSHDLVDSISRYIDWSGGGASPKILDISDFEKLAVSEACFARKIDSNYDKELVLRVLKMIGK